MKTLPSREDILRALVAWPSVSSSDVRFDQSNRAMVERLAEFAEAVGFTVRVMPVSADGQKLNLVARIGEGDGGLVLSGHTDTVPWDASAWSTDPFALEATDDGRLYGLGSADMKGFFACALHAARAFSAGSLKRPLTLLGTADEESSMDGARALVSEGVVRASYAVIGEPTGLVPVRKHKGVAMQRLRVTGISGHSSDPSLGRSALEGMHAVIGALLGYRDELAVAPRDDSFAVPVTTMNLGRIAGGDSPNRICGSCELDIDLRPLPGVSIRALREELSRRSVEAIAGRELSLVVEELFDGVPAFETAADARLVQAAEEATGSSGQAVMFGTEGPYLQQLGMETIILGPGDIRVAHQPNEFTTRSELERATELYGDLIQRFCVDAD